MTNVETFLSLIDATHKEKRPLSFSSLSQELNWTPDMFLCYLKLCEEVRCSMVVINNVLINKPPSYRNPILSASTDNLWYCKLVQISSIVKYDTTHPLVG